MERQQDNFVKWLVEMLNKHKISQTKLAGEIGIDHSSISRIVCRKKVATEKIKYLVINFFRNKYNEEYEASDLENVEPTTYGEWLRLVAIKNNISSKQLAIATGISNDIIRNIWNERTISNDEVRMKILDGLEEVYGVDTSRGRELLSNFKSNVNQKYSRWICDAMEQLGVNNSDIGKYLGIKGDNFSPIRNGRIVPTVERAELIFRFFDEHGIDISEGRKIFEEVSQRKCEE